MPKVVNLNKLITDVTMKARIDCLIDDVRSKLT